MSDYITWLADLDLESPKIGTHSRQLGKLIQAKFPLIPGFLITTDAYVAFLRENGLDHKIMQLLTTIAIERPDSLMQGERHIKDLFKHARLSDGFIEELVDFYYDIGEDVNLSLYETGPHGRKHAMVYANTPETLLEQIKNAWAQMYTSSALWHRHQRSISHLTSGAEIIVQAKIHGEKSGTVITIAPDNHKKDVITLISNHAHGEDTYVLSKKNLLIIDREMKHTTKEDKLTHEEILALGKLGKELEQFLYFPQEISWIIADGYLFITKLKPISTLAQKKHQVKPRLPIARGKGLTPKIATGIVTVMQTSLQLSKLQAHDIIVTSTITKKQAQQLKKIRGLIIESPHLHPEVTITLQHYGIPIITNVKHANKLLHDGSVITIHGGKGEIYRGGFL